MTTTTAPPPAVRTARKRRRVSVEQRGWLFVGPFAVVFALVFLAPLAYALYLSFFREQIVGGNAFVGFENYLTAFADPKLWDGFLRVLLFLLIQVPIMLVLALAAALAIDSARLHASGFYRIIIFLPYAVPAVVAVLMWGYIYGDQFGLAGNINDLLGAQVLRPFLPEWMMVSIGNIVTWQFVGYNMLIFYSSLKTIPGELYEAASLDGAGAWRTILSIKIPALRGSIVIATIFSIIGSFQLFNEPNILKPLAPNTITTFFTPNMYAYNLSFAGQQYNYAATVAIIMGVITAVIAYVVQLRGSRQEMR
ncbi:MULTISPECIES: carbohydrate ABC transporter permease [Microbacterium]|jgi:multiple sugar transport system permease protein|uniref:Multiple sugar transport system permease protein n=1 Tax=Microbacterium paludicola TaxID=300019 RepID=A0ABU1I4G8_9MICO|nr:MULTISPECIES: sugar ABC transporter permease [Microbacterium]APF34157.1 sugar ABC transporter permease [Microbacterium paludicola]MDQ1215149.1 multiple sugar transport system permease protein [Microbacterium arborescens]MDR6168526.1 multiple sugar transport system permease protein [Microbacterium paludicola]OWP20843.1 sugar ABC transporter permease [Microbacterium sp. AISO3]OYC97647.1 sugar ABC transporter permease [Microbacterium sp. Yaish 1]